VRKPAAEVNPFDDKVAIKTVCPHCGALDWFEWKFLGRLTDAICGHSWYAGSGTYTLMQIRAAFAAGGKGAKYMTSGLSGGQGAWIGKGMGWFIGVLRIPAKEIAHSDLMSIKIEASSRWTVIC
jgi:hypothetical protein